MLVILSLAVLTACSGVANGPDGGITPTPPADDSISGTVSFNGAPLDGATLGFTTLPKAQSATRWRSDRVGSELICSAATRTAVKAREAVFFFSPVQDTPRAHTLRRGGSLDLIVELQRHGSVCGCASGSQCGCQ